MAMRKILLLVFIIFCNVSFSQSKAEHLVNITSSKFTLYGTTNLNEYTCELIVPDSTGSIAVRTKANDYELRFTGLEMDYRINDFDCGLEAMSEDLKKTLKSKEFPYLTLRINKIKIKNEPQEIEKLSVTSEVTIILAGKSKNISIRDGYVVNHSENSVTLTGKQELNMSDFEISPPTKFFGMIVVNDELSVGFEINMAVRTF